MNLQEQIEKKAEEYAKFYEEDRTKIEYIAMDFKVGANLIINMLRWRDVEKELPEIGEKVFVKYEINGEVDYFMDRLTRKGGWDAQQLFGVKYTHWRPILEIE